MILVPYMEQANLIKDSMGTAIEKVLLSFVTLRPCLDREPVKAKKNLRFESSQFEVLNEVYL